MTNNLHFKKWWGICPCPPCDGAHEGEVVRGQQ